MNTKHRSPTRRTGIVQAVGEVLAHTAATKFNNQMTPDSARLALQAAIISAAASAGADPKKMPTLGVLLTSVIEPTKPPQDPRKEQAATIRAQIKALRGQLSSLK